ncbi:BREX-2 system phosphatase PglZ [Nocardia macrotermitis]|uniref:PglZ domain-containing protein n=1 Tax=Nocardia macrotermitis TaxID=2585198 RepID=A0A7K0DA56_9NOCA|nr:BREX-2 system phosphatase PglZ [Nocardia macrotermitis]MQY22655.1 hypothetical protein [Nocardia macrotermitis]
MSETATHAALPRLKSADVAHYLSADPSVADALTGRGDRTVVLLRAEPSWEGPGELTMGDHRALVASAPSALAVHELVLHHLETPDGPQALVVLTDREHEDLDPAILSRTHRRRVNPVDRWDIVRNAFGATGIDEWIKREPWAAEALLDAAGPNGWPRVPGALSRGEALSALASRRLRLPPSGTDRIDPATLLHWSHIPGNPELFLDLRDRERDGLTTFLTDDEQAGAVAAVLIELVRAGHGADAVSFGLVVAALWLHPEPDGGTYQARGRAERRLGERPAVSTDELDHRMMLFGRACLDYFDVQLSRANDPRARSVNGRVSDPGTDSDTPWSLSARAARRIVDPILRRAGELAHELGAGTAAEASPVLRAGLDARFIAVGNALSRNDSAATAGAVRELLEHRLAGDPELEVRIRRVEMAQRLARWLADDPDTTVDTVVDALDRHMREISWVDRALSYLEAGGDTDPALTIPYRTLGNEVRKRRRGLDHAFATTFAAEKAAGADQSGMLTVETFLSRVVAPIAGYRRVLLLVVDGMSAAIATELADRLLDGWNEYDPCPEGGDPRRRVMTAVEPSSTAVVRTSLFAGKPMQGDRSAEKREFSRHSFWGTKKTATVLDLDDPESRGDDLAAVLADPDQHLAVVLKSTDLPDLLRTAAEEGMAVLITGDHSGASVAEATIPILAFLPFGVESPILSRQPVWRQLGDQSPYWWSSDRPAAAATHTSRGTPARRRTTDRAAKERMQGLEPMFELPEISTATSPSASNTVDDDLVARLLGSDIFQGQRALLARPPQPATVDKAIRALLRGPLPITALAQRVGFPAVRATGFAAILSQLLNFDGITVLETLGDGRTLKLDVARLRTQFGV